MRQTILLGSLIGIIHGEQMIEYTSGEQLIEYEYESSYSFCRGTMKKEYVVSDYDATWEHAG